MNEKNAGRLMDSLGKTADSWFEQENIKAEYMMWWKARIYVDIEMFMLLGVIYFFKCFAIEFGRIPTARDVGGNVQDKVFEVKGCL